MSLLDAAKKLSEAIEAEGAVELALDVVELEVNRLKSDLCNLRVARTKAQAELEEFLPREKFT